MKKNWYVIHTISHQENKVKQSLERIIENRNLQDKITSIIIPTREEVRFRQGGRRIIKRKIFPGYIFVEMELTQDCWYLVRKTSGVTGFVGVDSNPSPLRENEVMRILKQGGIKIDELGYNHDFQIGDSIQVLSGPFSELVGKILEVYPEKGKMKVLLSLFERDTPVELDFDQVERI